MRATTTIVIVGIGVAAAVNKVRIVHLSILLAATTCYLL